MNIAEELKNWTCIRVDALAELSAKVEELTAANIDLTERVLYAERERDEARGCAEKWHSLCIAVDEGDISMILEGATETIDGGEIVTSIDDVLDHIEARRSTR